MIGMKTWFCLENVDLNNDKVLTAVFVINEILHYIKTWYLFTSQCKSWCMIFINVKIGMMCCALIIYFVRITNLKSSCVPKTVLFFLETLSDLHDNFVVDQAEKSRVNIVSCAKAPYWLSFRKKGLIIYSCPYKERYITWSAKWITSIHYVIDSP